MDFHLWQIYNATLLEQIVSVSVMLGDWHPTHDNWFLHPCTHNNVSLANKGEKAVCDSYFFGWPTKGGDHCLPSYGLQPQNLVKHNYYCSRMLGVIPISIKIGYAVAHCQEHPYVPSHHDTATHWPITLPHWGAWQLRSTSRWPKMFLIRIMQVSTHVYIQLFCHFWVATYKVSFICWVSPLGEWIQGWVPLT